MKPVFIYIIRFDQRRGCKYQIIQILSLLSYNRSMGGRNRYMKALCGFFEGSYYNRIRVWLKCLSVMLMLAAILLTGCTGSEDVQSGDTDKVTASDTLEQSDAADSNKQIFMIYMIGSDLETDRGLASSDINEIVSAGFDTDRVEVYLCTGGALSWHNEAISAYECAIYEVNSKGLNKLTALHGNDMTSPDTVTEFIDTVSGEYSVNGENYIHEGSPESIFSTFCKAVEKELFKDCGR